MAYRWIVNGMLVGIPQEQVKALRIYGKVYEYAQVVVRCAPASCGHVASNNTTIILKDGVPLHYYVGSKAAYTRAAIRSTIIRLGI
jgi:hypothetical protein